MSDDESRLERGNRVRREVLGDAHVDRSMLRATEFTRVVQEYVTASCWGDVWSRPGLDRRTRSLLNLAMLTALNRPHEFTVHIRGALRNGCTEADIQEALLQTAAYCGAPAALESFRLAERTIEEVRQEAATAASAGNPVAEAGNAAAPGAALGVVAG
nr:carboxymuconolactone decarboxylase family protein [Micromonospora sp. DSM 115978]